MQSDCITSLNNSSQVLFPGALTFTVGGCSRALQVIAACRRTSAQAPLSHMINDWHVASPCTSLRLDSLLIHAQFLILTSHRKAEEHDSPFSPCHLPAVTAVNILDAFPSLSSCSASWSNRSASQAKTWASCALAFVPVPPPQLPTQSVVSALSPHAHTSKYWYSHHPACVTVLPFMSQSSNRSKLWHTDCHQGMLSIMGSGFSLNHSNWLDILDQYAPISEITVIQNSPMWPYCTFSHVVINYLECTLSINAAKQYWLQRHSSM